jgi:hypothetical protein
MVCPLSLTSSIEHLLTIETVGWIATLPTLADILNIQGFRIVHFVMTIIMCATWLILFILTLVAFWKGRIFNSKDEDVIKDASPRSSPRTSYEKSMA